MDVNMRDPMASKPTNIATVKPMQLLTKLPGPGLSRLPRPGSASIPQPAAVSIPKPAGIPRAHQPTQQKRKTPDRENMQQSAPKRTKLNSSSTAPTYVNKPTKAITAPKTRASTRTAVRPSKAAKAKPTTDTLRPISNNTNTSNSNKPPTSTTHVKKRAPWDMKGRLLDMEALMKNQTEQNLQLQSHMSENQERIDHLEGQKQQLEVKTHTSTREVDELRRKLQQSEETLYNDTREMRRTIEDLEFSKSSVSRQNCTLEGELTVAQTEIQGLRGSIAEITSSQAVIKSEFSVAKINLEKALADGRLKDSQISDLHETLAQHEKTIDENKADLRKEETTRRKLHNIIQELKGNIRVFCRVRPLLGAERECNDGEIQHISYPDENTLELEKLSDVAPNETLTGQRKGANKYEFKFDRVFTPDSKQAEVFHEISQLVQSSLDGYNICIFAYGQTGSGKTFTMEGPETITEETEGMIPRAVRQVFSSAHELADKGWKYEFKASFLEIYNETIRDLLTEHNDDVKLEVKMVEANSNDTYVSNLTTYAVTNQIEVTDLLSKASENRATAETKCNERSSRSHSVFCLKIDGENEFTHEKCTGILNLIDLAGSERLKDSGAEGVRLKETLSINKSLSNLGNVIMALANKENHVPYRNSKLTHLLMNSLGGSSKTLMFVNVSPKEDCFCETVNSLRFATKVNNCSIGTAAKKVKL